MWEKWGDPFSKHYKIRDRQYWNEFWDNCPYTQKQIYTALRNIFYATRDTSDEYGIPLERRYVSPDPCKFIQGGMIARGLSEELQDHWRWNYSKNGHDQNLEEMRDD